MFLFCFVCFLLLFFVSLIYLRFRYEKMQRLCSVMGINWGYDPDASYELTGDNVKKILAIYMRFRCGIPVVIMGETGCGKTRLIRYMCGLQTWGVKDRKNLLLMKVIKYNNRLQ